MTITRDEIQARLDQVAPIPAKVNVASEPVCSECDNPIRGEIFPCHTCRRCFAELDGPYDDDDEDNEE